MMSASCLVGLSIQDFAQKQKKSQLLQARLLWNMI